jgi:pseudaminic acid synthase
MKIGNYNIDQHSPCFIIAELSANHNGSLEKAIETIKSAKRAGANAIKLQTYTPDTITINCDKDDFIIKGTIWEGRNLHKLYQEAFTPWEWHEILFKTAKDEGLVCFSSPFDKSAVDLLESLNTPAYKIASFEITDIPLIEYTASKLKPIILSTGISTQEDISLAIEACLRVGNNNIALLKCTSSYPAPLEEANLLMIKDLADRYDVISGLSDHTIGSIAPIVSICFGAKIIEKHFIIDRKIGGPDSSFSMNEQEFTEMVNLVRQAESAIGLVDYTLSEKQKISRAHSRSLYIVKDSKIGDLVTNINVKSIRPGYGLHPKYLPIILGSRFIQNVEKGERFDLNLIEKINNGE